MTKTKQISIRLPTDLLEKMEQLAERNTRPLAGEVQHALKEYVEFHWSDKGLLSASDLVELMRATPEYAERLEKSRQK